jgi:hypothetical protein
LDAIANDAFGKGAVRPGLPADERNGRTRVTLSADARAFIAAGGRAAMRGRIVLGVGLTALGIASAIALTSYISAQARAKVQVESALLAAEADRKRAELATSLAQNAQKYAEEQERVASTQRDNFNAGLDRLEAKVSAAITLREFKQIQAEIRANKADAGPAVSPVASQVSKPNTTSSSSAQVGDPP